MFNMLAVLQSPAIVSAWKDKLHIFIIISIWKHILPAKIPDLPSILKHLYFPALDSNNNLCFVWDPFIQGISNLQ